MGLGHYRKGSGLCNFGRKQSFSLKCNRPVRELLALQEESVALAATEAARAKRPRKAKAAPARRRSVMPVRKLWGDTGMHRFLFFFLGGGQIHVGTLVALVKKNVPSN